ncbi:MAG TPA: GSU2403 family nucleotidyltransferase fold protein [Acidiferrobacterales bacterium]
MFTPHRRALTVLYADVESHALQQREVFVGTAGSVIERRNASGFRFYAHQFYDGEGKKRERYLAGPVGNPKADGAAAELRGRIQELKEIVPSLRLLGREGFNLADAKTYATLASLHNHGVFAAGGMLIGSHAYGVLLNRMGVRATPYATEDIDIARREALTFERPPEQGLLEMLKDSGIPFVEVPSLNRKKPPTSFKQRGRSRFHVDLLVPSANEDFPVVRVPELQAHATGLPYLSYLLAESQTAMMMARGGCCPVRVPVPERFAVHKLIVSRLRTGREAKSDKDVFQACVLCAALAESHPGAVEAAVAQIPRRAKKYLAPAVGSTRRFLEPAHQRAWEELSGAAIT